MRVNQKLCLCNTNLITIVVVGLKSSFWFCLSLIIVSILCIKTPLLFSVFPPYPIRSVSNFHSSIFIFNFNGFFYSNQLVDKLIKSKLKSCYFICWNRIFRRWVSRRRNGSLSAKMIPVRVIRMITTTEFIIAFFGKSNSLRGNLSKTIYSSNLNTPIRFSARIFVDGTLNL